MPAGSTVVQALLYAKTLGFAHITQIGFAGNVVPVTELPHAIVDSPACCTDFFPTFRADVTSIVAGVVGGGGGIFDFVINESAAITEAGTQAIDGTALFVIYSNPSLPSREIHLLEGGLTGPTPDIEQVSLLSPYTGGPAEMGVAISFSAGLQEPVPAHDCPVGGMVTVINVEDRLLSPCAGNKDDGDANANGTLMTVGGIGDDLLNPGVDDERYDLTSFLTPGDAVIDMDFSNASDDDSLFALYVQLETTAFQMPSSGFVGWIFHQGFSGRGIDRVCALPPLSSHLGVDIWSARNDGTNGNVSQGNPVFLPHAGTLVRKRFDRLVFRHDDVVIDGNPVFSLYFHMADQVTGTSYVNPSLTEGSTYPAATPLGNQGNRKAGARYKEDVVVHLHFSISTRDFESLDASKDPSPLLNLQVNACEASPVAWMHEVTAGTGKPAPVISSVSPLEVSPGEFVLTITGQNFDTMSAVPSSCSDGAHEQIFFNRDGHFVGQGEIVSRTSTQLVVRENIRVPGTYNLMVRNSDCQQSRERFQVVVRAAA